MEIIESGRQSHKWDVKPMEVVDVRLFSRARLLSKDPHFPSRSNPDYVHTAAQLLIWTSLVMVKTS